MSGRVEPDGDRACPECGSERIRRIVYGLPDPELTRRAERGEVILGGCMLPAEATWGCLACGSEW